jgi:1-acyl-sn-glycerol-3-phosphate acyltransferase
MTDWRDTKTWYTYETWFAGQAKFYVGAILHQMAQVECEGFDTFPMSGPCIVASNHFSLWDVLYLGVNMPRFPHFMAKRELFKNPLMAWGIRQVGAFPVNRGTGDLWAMAQAGRVLADGEVLCMFPEGTRGKHKTELKQGKAGVVKLALQHQTPIVPTAIWGTEIFKIGWKRNKIHIRTGPPLDVAQLAGPPPYKHEVPRELTTLVMQRIAAMLPPEYRGIYA